MSMYRPFLMLLLLLLPRSIWAQGVTHTRKTVVGIPVEIVTVDLRNASIRVTPVLAHGKIGRSEPLGSMVTRTNGTAGISGAFFDTKHLKPIGDIVIGGKLVHFGGQGAAICLIRSKRKKKPSLIAQIRSTYALNRHTDWHDCESVLAGGMWLVKSGRVALDPQKQGFRDAGLFRPTQRAAVGVADQGKKLILVATDAPVRLNQWANVLKYLGAVEAMNLDGGSSTGLIYRGNRLVRSGRPIVDALVVHEKSPQNRHLANTSTVLSKKSVVRQTALQVTRVR